MSTTTKTKRRGKSNARLPEGAADAKEKSEGGKVVCTTCHCAKAAGRATIGQLEMLHGLIAHTLIEHFESRAKEGKKPLSSYVKIAAMFLHANKANANTLPQMAMVAADLPKFEDPLF